MVLSKRTHVENTTYQQIRMHVSNSSLSRLGKETHVTDKEVKQVDL